MYHISFSFEKNSYVIFFLACIIFFAFRENVPLLNSNVSQQCHKALAAKGRPRTCDYRTYIEITGIKTQHFLFFCFLVFNFFPPCWKEDMELLYWDLCYEYKISMSCLSRLFLLYKCCSVWQSVACGA